MGELDRRPRPDRPTPSARVGAVVDRYTLVRVLGQGGMGAVYEARHATLSRRFAIKFLLPGAGDEPGHPAPVRERGEGGRRSRAPEPRRGDRLRPRRRRRPVHRDGVPARARTARSCSSGSGPLPVPRAVNIVVQACRGLAVAHRAGIVHRDLKPENLFLTDAGDGSDLVKVLDFGIAKLRVSDASVITGTGATFGTAFYMSPEQARGAGEVDARTRRLVAGRRPLRAAERAEAVRRRAVPAGHPPDPERRARRRWRRCAPGCRRR